MIWHMGAIRASRCQKIRLMIILLIAEDAQVGYLFDILPRAQADLFADTQED